MVGEIVLAVHFQWRMWIVQLDHQVSFFDQSNGDVFTKVVPESGFDQPRAQVVRTAC